VRVLLAAEPEVSGDFCESNENGLKKCFDIILLVKQRQQNFCTSAFLPGTAELKRETADLSETTLLGQQRLLQPFIAAIVSKLPIHP